MPINLQRQHRREWLSRSRNCIFCMLLQMAVCFVAQMQWLLSLFITYSRWLNNETKTVAIPTHFYKIIIRCNNSVSNAAGKGSIPGCNGVLEAMAFIFPHIETPICKVSKRYFLKFRHFTSYHIHTDIVKRALSDPC